ncbi:unnamed protein product [Rotaria sordida]|uniref:Uncharacterized protein n=1 Tax=Rotaria sordida TaxID=392033 RepID=A0A814B1G4_9BILA|nr:unnamed protein product [Rotaria sordida]
MIFLFVYLSPKGTLSLREIRNEFDDLYIPNEQFNDVIQLDLIECLNSKKDDVQQIQLRIAITKTALFIVLRVMESIVEITTKGTRKFPSLNSIISYILSSHTELPIHDQILVDWYNAAHVLDLLFNYSD